MKYDEMKATVRGKTCEGEDFVEKLIFKMIPPDKDSNYYGTGYYMRVIMSLNGNKWIDARYEGTTDVEILADRFIKNWYGSNAEEVSKEFAVE